MSSEIDFVADHMFPKAPLPQMVFAPALAPKGHAPVRECPREARFDGSPSPRKILVPFGQGPNRVQMAGKHYNRTNDKWRLPFYGLKGSPQRVAMFDQQM